MARETVVQSLIESDSKMILYIFLLNAQYYKVGIKGKLDQSRERSSAIPYTSLL